MTPPDLSELLGRFDGLLVDHLETKTQPPSKPELIIDELTAVRTPLSVDQLAERVGLWPRETAKVLTTLTGPKCPRRHVGKVTRCDDGRFIAAG